MTSTDHVLALIHRALDEFDDRPLQVSVRRAVRIASLIGDSRAAARLAYELRPTGGDPTANSAVVKRLMADSSTWNEADGPAGEALREYMRDRLRSDNPNENMVYAYSLDSIEFWEERSAVLRDHEDPKAFAVRVWVG
ncbi:hypothetical protein [Actinacidiphila oryziradicis]|uniref:Uncharacterized protein n=1 Tax=Actinacidiphila oryziradicis TaxID=2571141 RepID=A0A4V6WIW2_9ACTN|nr:hypothetical protein [Actinacidiphila oryziradicis]TJZ96268.1 hypothetical protein FCI23_51255 [Actinacidiphila oryziradicis]